MDSRTRPSSIPTSVKIAFVDALTAAGIPVIEVTSFVNPKAVPQLSDAPEVMAGIQRANGTCYPVLVPNQRGLERALESGADAIAVFTSATEAFAHANVGTSIAGTFERFQPVVLEADQRGLWVRGYVSVAFGCPYSGAVEPRSAITVTERLLELGCDEVCLADTIGTATPDSVTRHLARSENIDPRSIGWRCISTTQLVPHWQSSTQASTSAFAPSTRQPVDSGDARLHQERPAISPRSD